jgi:hypothetical protein
MLASNVSENWGINFTEKGIEIADAQDVATAVMNLFVAAFALQNKTLNTSYTTPQGQLATSLAAIINNKNIDFLRICNNFDIDKATGVWLDALCALFNISRKASVPTTVNCLCTGLAGTVIYGMNEENPSKVSDLSGNIYICQTTTTIPAGGSVTVTFQNEVGGNISCPSDTVNTIVTTTAGWDTVNNPSAGIVGSDTETDAELRKRYKQFVNNNASGTIGSLVSAVLGLEGVLDCVGAENPSGAAISVGGYTIQPNTYSLSVLGGNGSDIAGAMYEKHSMATQTGNTTVTYTDPDTNVSYNFSIVRPTKLSYFFKVTLANEASLPADIADKVKSAIYEDFYDNRVKINSTTYASRFFNAVNSVADNIEIVSIEVASQPAGGSLSAYGNSVTCNFDQYPDLETTNISVEFDS